MTDRVDIEDSLAEEVDRLRVAVVDLREQRDHLLDRAARLRDALRHVAGNLDYLQSLWGSEGVTRSTVDTVRAALGEGEGG